MIGVEEEGRREGRRSTHPQAAYVVAAGTVAVLVMVSVVAATLCESVIDFVTVRVVVVVQNTVAGKEDWTTLAAGDTAAAFAAALDVSERMGVKPGEVGMVVVPLVLVLVMVVRYSVRVVVTVKAVVYVGTEEVLVLPSWVEQDAAWTMRWVFWKRTRRERKEEVGESNMMAAVLWSFASAGMTRSRDANPTEHDAIPQFIMWQ